MSTALSIGVAVGTPLLSSAFYASEAIRKSIVSTATQIAKGMVEFESSKEINQTLVKMNKLVLRSWK
jgi:hypothetical protein